MLLSAGLVVMNVKWRGKTYCGAFIDIEKHSWQPPRYVTFLPTLFNYPFNCYLVSFQIPISFTLNTVGCDMST